MKKLPALLNTPARAVIAVGLIMLVCELLIMAVIEGVIAPFITHGLWHFIDPILLIAIVSPALYILILQPMRKQQAELEDARKKIEQAFQEWIAALDVVDDPIFLHDREFRVLRCNKAYQQLAGIPLKQILGRPYYDVFPKTGAPLPSCLRAMEAGDEEEELVVGEASYRSRAYAIHDEQGAYRYSVHILEDVTARQQAEAQLKLFRNLLDQSSDGFSIVAPDTSRFLDVNEALCRLLGYPRDELLQRGVVDIQTNIRDVAAWQMHRQALRSQGYALVEFDSLHKDGTQSAVEVSLRYIADKNQDYIIAVVRDITERKQAEQKMRLTQFAMENASIEIYWLDKDARIHYVNKQACAVLGYTQEELLRLSIPDIDPLFPEAQWKAHWQSLLRDKTLFFETMHKRKDGVVFPIEVVANYVKFGDLEYNVAFAKDITGRKQAQATQLFLAESGYTQGGENFFQLLARYLAQTLKMDYVCIDRLEGDQLSARTVAIYSDGEFEDNVSYTLKDTPCGDVVAKKFCCFSKGVRQLFPQDAALQMLLAESYVGTTLFGFDGKPIGLIAVIGRQPLVNPHLAESLLQMVSARTVGELERQQAEAKLAEQLAELRRWHEITSGREERILELKHELNELLGKSGLPPRYPSAES